MDEGGTNLEQLAKHSSPHHGHAASGTAPVQFCHRRVVVQQLPHWDATEGLHSLALNNDFGQSRRDGPIFDVVAAQVDVGQRGVAL